METHLKTALLAMTAVAATFLMASDATAHCQVPCGIYDDHARIHAMREDARTIAKATLKIGELAPKTDALSKNQLARWVAEKEAHASRIISVTSEYFLTQKIKPPSQKDKKAWATYVTRLVACHKVMRAAMKAKQSISDGAVSALNEALDGLAALYPAGK